MRRLSPRKRLIFRLQNYEILSILQKLLIEHSVTEVIKQSLLGFIKHSLPEVVQQSLLGFIKHSLPEVIKQSLLKLNLACLYEGLRTARE
jgi:hypothetical protein